jgi:hypothetical protein
MKNPTLIASMVLATLSGCTTPNKDKDLLGMDLSKVLPPPSAGVVSQTSIFPSDAEAREALAGYNYELIALPSGEVKAIVTGLNGSGADNLITASSPTVLAATTIDTATATASNEDNPPFPAIDLKERKQGKNAIDALGDQLNAVASAYNMSPERLKDILENDSSAWLDQNGRMLYIENEEEPTGETPLVDGAPSPGETHLTDAAPSIAGAAVPVSTGDLSSGSTGSVNAFKLHSKPGSNKLIYLDFNGHTVTNTAWGSATIKTGPYDVDGYPATFSDAEQANIQNIWARVAEDFKPFDVDVTTEPPTAANMQRTSATDTQYGTRVVITQSNAAICGSSCGGGISYVGVFNFSSSSNPNFYKPSWVFEDKLGNGNPKYVAEAVAHEAGHFLGLHHDGTSTATYYKGHGADAIGWAPIMGNSYSKPVTQWSKGEYPGANNKEDDLSIIQSGGLPLRLDDYPNAIASAAPLGGTAAAVSQSGIIGTRTDVDVFSFLSGAGSALFTFTPDTASADLDIKVTLLDALGNTIAVANPADALNASLSVSLAKGTYFLKVEGTGAGDLTTGYSDYASIGKYKITGHHS